MAGVTWRHYLDWPGFAWNQPTDAECAAVDVSALASARFTYPALDTAKCPACGRVWQECTCLSRCQWNYPCPACGLNVWQGCACLSPYSESHVPTERLSPAAPSPQTCECGSGSNERSGAHSHWCRLWTAS